MAYINRPLDTSPTTTMTIKAGGDRINDNFEEIPNLLAAKANSADLSTVATTGNYNDLLNKPDLSVLEEVLVFPTFGDFPVTGETQKVYIAENTGYMYRWSGVEYVQLTDQTAIWGQISGTLSNQTDLQNALNAKANQTFVEGEVSDLQGQINLKANDDEVVKLTGNQSITGVKTFDNVAFDTTTTTEATKAQFAWNEDEGTLDLGLNGGNVTLQLGQETVYRVTNNSGATIANGMLVMAVGTVGASGRILVAPYDGTSPSKRIMGLATEDIPNGQDGYVTHFGKVRGINTSAYQEGDILWASPSGNGALTKVKPEAPNTKTVVAIVINSHASVGTVLVRVSQGSNLDDDELVELGTLSNGETLFFNAANGRFENRLIQQSDVQGLVGALDDKVDKVTGKQLSTEDYTTAEKNKLAGIATGATANATDAQLRDRSTHTGTQPHTTVTGLGTAATRNVTSIGGSSSLLATMSAVGDVTNHNAATGTITIPSGLAIGTRRLIRKIHPTQGTVTINCSGETFTRANLASVELNADGDYWLLEKVSATRWELVDGWNTGENANGTWVRRANGEQVCQAEKNHDFSTINYQQHPYPVNFSSTLRVKSFINFFSTNSNGRLDAYSRTLVLSNAALQHWNISNRLTQAETLLVGFQAIGRWYE